MKNAICFFMILLCVACQAGDVTNMNGRGIRLLSLMNEEAKGANAAMSYYSIAQVLSMTELGAKGDTAVELRDGLSLRLGSSSSRRTKHTRSTERQTHSWLTR